MAGPEEHDGPPTSAGADVERGAEGSERGAEGSVAAESARPLYAPIVPGWEQVRPLAPSLPVMQRAMERPAESLTTRRPVAAPVSTEPLGHVVEEDAPNGLVVARAVSAPAPTEDDTPAPEMPLRPPPKKKQPPTRRGPVVEEAIESPADEPEVADEVVEPPAPMSGPDRVERRDTAAAPLPLAEADDAFESFGDDEAVMADEPAPAPEVKPLARPVPTVDVAPPPPKPVTIAAEAPLPLPVSRLVTVDRPVADLPPAEAPPAPEPALPVAPAAAVTEPEPAPDEPAPPTVTTTLGQQPSVATPIDRAEATEEEGDPGPAPLATPGPAPAAAPPSAPDEPTPPEPTRPESVPARAAEGGPPETAERPGPLTSLTRGMRDMVAQRFSSDSPEPVAEATEAPPPLAPLTAAPESPAPPEAAVEPELDEGEEDAPEEPVAAPAPPTADEPAPRTPAPVQRLETGPSLAMRPLPLVVARQVSQPEPRPAPPVEVVRRVETATGVPLDRVTVNRDASATRTTQAHQARAVTVGDTVHMNPDEGALDEPQGRGLVAHELVHAAQQQVLGPPPEPDTEEGRHLEASAQRVEEAEAAGRTLPSMPLAAPSEASREPAVPATPLPLAPVAPPAPNMDSIVNQVVAASPPGTVQRTAEGGIEMVTPSAVEPPPPIATAPSAPVAAAPASVQTLSSGAPEPKTRTSDGDLDEQARRLYPRLRSMLAAELRLERERAGRLSDVRY